MPEENMNPEFWLKKINEIRNYLIEEINRNELMSKKHKNFCRVLNDIDHLLIGTSTITICVSISAFAFLVDIPIGAPSTAIGLKICVITPKSKSISQQLTKKREEAR